MTRPKLVMPSKGPTDRPWRAEIFAEAATTWKNGRRSVSLAHERLEDAMNWAWRSMQRLMSKRELMSRVTVTHAGSGWCFDLNPESWGGQTPEWHDEGLPERGSKVAS